MNTKIDSFIQTSVLNVGDIINKYPKNGLFVRSFDSMQSNLIECFEVQFANKKNKMVSLVLAKQSRILFASPGDVSKEFISEKDLIDQGIWWLFSE